MTENDKITKIQNRNRAMGKARDEVLNHIASWLIERGFNRAGAGHFTRANGNQVSHIGFQKLSTGRDLRVTCHITDDNGLSICGPRSDPYGCPNSPNGRKYWFAWNTNERDIARSTAEHCQFISDVVFKWFEEQGQNISDASTI